MKLVAPCKNCPDRTITCHGSCEKYKSWVKSRELTNEQKAERLLDSYVAHQSELNKQIHKKSST